MLTNSLTKSLKRLLKLSFIIFIPVLLTGQTLQPQPTTGKLNFPVTFVWTIDSTGANKDTSMYYTFVLAMDSLGTKPILVDSMIADKYNGKKRVFPDTTIYVQPNSSSFVYGEWLWWKVQTRTATARSAWSVSFKFKIYRSKILVTSEPTPFATPTKDIVKMSFFVESAQDKPVLEISDALGSTVKKFEPTPPIGVYTASFDLSNLPIGKYYVKINSGPSMILREVVKN